MTYNQKDRAVTCLVIAIGLAIIVGIGVLDYNFGELAQIRDLQDRVAALETNSVPVEVRVVEVQTRVVTNCNHMHYFPIEAELEEFPSE